MVFTKHFRRIGIPTLFFACIVHPLFSQQPKSLFRREFPSLVAGDAFWVGTPNGLYRYQYEDDAWAAYGMHNGLPSNDIRILLWDGEWLWAGTPDGVAGGDVKLNKWLSYSEKNGLPGSRILCIAREGDYVWVGTDRGAARYDKIIQEWESFTAGSGLPDSVVYDIASDGDLVYFATRKGLAEYDVRFEKWRTYGRANDIPSDTIRYIHPAAEYLWLFTDRGPARFNKKLHTAVPFPDPRLEFAAIRDLAVENEQIWLATDSGVILYDPSNSIWREFPQKNNLPDPFVRAMCFTQDSRWFITDKGISVFETGNQSWRRFDRTSGLSSDRYEAAAVFQGRTFLFNERTIDHYRPEENQWYVYPLAGTGSGKSGMTFSLNPERGSFIQLGDSTRFSLSGTRVRQLTNGAYDFDRGLDKGQYSSRSVTRMDLKTQLRLPRGRILNGFYDNTDLSQTFYGVNYRGADSDLIREAAWGDIRVEQGKNELMPTLGIFGTSARLEYGTKTERYRRSLLSVRGFSGERITSQETEFFRGNLKSSGTELRDTYYVRHTFFRIDTTGAADAIDGGSETVYVDDGDPSTNTANTLAGAVLAGTTGDFDRLHPVAEYRLDPNGGILQLLAPPAETATVIVSGKSRGVFFERVLKTPGHWEHELVNRYFIGGMDILPYSFVLDIVDTLGAAHPLAEFRLDRNGDGRIDPEFIDYREGLLAFPMDRPFPAQVYDPVHPESRFGMRARFQSEIPTFTLRHANLLRGSEVLKVDGDILIAGNDYVLDYTSGTLLILKEGVVAEDSEIEIRYEYYTDTRDRGKFHSVGIGFSPSDDAVIECSAFGFDAGDGPGDGDPVQGLDFFGEFRSKMRGVDLKFTPQVAADRKDSNHGRHVSVRTDASSRRMRLFAQYEKIDPEYTTLFERSFQMGRLGERMETGGTVYPFGCLDIGGGWIRQSTNPGPEGSSIEEDWNGKVLFNKPLFPAISLSFRKQNLAAPEWASEKRTLKGDFEYKIPASSPILRAFSFQSLHMSGVLRRSWEKVNPATETASNPATRKVLDNGYFRMDFSPAERVQIDAYYRASRNRSGESFSGLSGIDGEPYSRKQKLFFTATVDRFAGLNGYLLYQGEAAQFCSSPVETAGSLSLTRSLLAMLRVYPGRWIPFLSSYTFELNVQPEFRGTMQNVDEGVSVLERFWDFSSRTEASRFDRNRTLLFRNEWRPSAALTVYLDYEKGEGTSRSWGSLMNTERNRIFEKTEYRPSRSTLFTVQYQRIRDLKPGYSDFITDNPVLWLETRWSERFQTKCNLSLWRENRHTGKTGETVSNFSPLAGMTYRLYRSGFRIEIRDDVSASLYAFRRPDQLYRTDTFYNSLALDCYTPSVLILKLRGTAAYKNRPVFEGDFWSLAFECRLTAQF